MTKGTSIKAHVSEYTALLNEMERIGIKMENEDKAIVLLCSLSSSYKGFKQTMLHSRHLLNLEDMEGNLLVKTDIDSNFTSSESSHKDVGKKHGKKPFEV
jgi:gag-polypeptide of LTR copia-type